MLTRIVSFLIFICCALSGCGQSYTLTQLGVSVEASFRGLSVVDEKVAWASGTKGTVGITSDGGQTWKFSVVKGNEGSDFRSLYAFDERRAIIANVGSPAYILSTEDGGLSWMTAYTNNHADAFFDGIDFWNERDGVIYGDPINGKMLMLRTSDGGKTWVDIATAPLLEKGEASFAASGTGIRCTGKKDILVCTGGIVSRLWISADGGENWTSNSPPVLQGKPTTGIFSVAIAGNTIVLVGGDFQDASLNRGHHLVTNDRGKNWAIPKTPARGYRECVEFIARNTWVAVGPEGVDISTDGGSVWQPLSDEKGLHTILKGRKGNLVIAAGSKGKLFILNTSPKK